MSDETSAQQLKIVGKLVQMGGEFAAPAALRGEA